MLRKGSNKGGEGALKGFFHHFVNFGGLNLVLAYKRENDGVFVFEYASV